MYHLDTKDWKPTLLHGGVSLHQRPMFYTHSQLPVNTGVGLDCQTMSNQFQLAVLGQRGELIEFTSRVSWHMSSE